jgi:hypothetical protein
MTRLQKSISSIRPWIMTITESTRIPRRRLEQKLYPGAPSATLMALVPLAVILLFVVLSLVGIPWWKSPNNECKRSDLGCGLSIHVGGSILVGILVYYLIFLRRSARAAAKWRSRMLRTPLHFFTWVLVSGGLTGMAATNTATGEIQSEETRWSGLSPRRRRSTLVTSIIGREDLVTEIADDLDDDSGPQIIAADAASGKTMVLVKLADTLARRGQVPIPISLRGVGRGELDFGDRAREAFGKASTETDHEEAMKQWRWLRRRQLITVIADDLEKAGATPDDVVQAIGHAAGEKLRLVIAARPYAIPDSIPAYYRARRIDLEPLNEKEIHDELCRLLVASGHSDGFVQNLADRAKLSESPYLFQVVRVLAQRGELKAAGDELFAGLSEERVRSMLLGIYRDALAAATLRPDAGLKSERRQEMLEDLEAIAYVRVSGWSTIRPARRSPHVQQEMLDGSAVADEPGDLGIADVESVVRDARRLGLVMPAHDGKVRFAQSMTLAYLASRYLARPSTPAGAWHAIAKQAWSPLRATTLTMASAERARASTDTSARDRITETYGRVLARVSSREEESEADDFARLGSLTTAAKLAGEVHGFDPSKLVDFTRDELAGAGTVGREHMGVVEALANLNAPSVSELLWSYATASVDSTAQHTVAVNYSVRLRALTALAEPHSLETCARNIRHIMTETEEFMRTHKGLTLDDDDRGQPFDSLRAVAWVLPMLRSSACSDSLKAELTDVQHKLLEYAGLSERGDVLTFQRVLESSIAEGLKLDAAQNQERPVDPVAFAMLEDKSARARFWFSRVLLLQALTLRSKSAPDRIRAALRARQTDEHEFVRRTAKACLQALPKDPSENTPRAPSTEWLFEDVGEFVGKAPRGTAPEVCQLVGDMALALNLNEYGTPATRKKFGEAKKLPACLSSSLDRSRLVVVAKVDPAVKCPFADDSACLCPYTFEAPPGAIRRELSRAFCRHLRLHARPIPWQQQMKPKDIRHFWGKMEEFASY